MFIVVVVVLGLVVATGVRARAAGTSTITGIAFKDTNRDGSRQSDEDPFADHRVYLFDTAGSYLKNALSDATGAFSLTGLSPGRYEVRYSPSSWWAIRDNWVPTTTGSIFPSVWVDVDQAATADFGWRPIVRSTDIDAPISQFVGPEGLRVQSYNDAVSAREVHDAVTRGTVGEEAPYVTVRLDYGSSDVTATGVGTSDGVYRNYKATSYVSYLTWLDSGERVLGHEYGHAWSLYYAYMVQQDGTLASYLEARSLTGDERIGSSYAWSPREMIAEDYRQLLGSEAARLGNQTNRDIPPASEVPGLEDFLRDVFTRAPAGDPTSEPTVEPSPTATAEPSPEPSTDPTPEPTSGPVRGKKGSGGGKGKKG